jgi:hypothetical protein
MAAARSALLWALAAYAGFAAAAAPARADEAKDAPEFFRAGTAAYERGEFRAAALAFEGAHRARGAGDDLQRC